MFMNLTRVYDFLQILHIKRGSLPKMIIFPLMQFTTIYLLQKQKLHYNKYSEHEINMIYFIPATKNDMNMHAKIQCMNMHVFL
jgi:hypothetical protein